MKEKSEREIGDQEVFHTRKRTRTGEHVAGNDERKYDKQRHHDSRNLFDAVFNAHEDDAECHCRKDNEPEFGRRTTADKGCKERVVGNQCRVMNDELIEIFAYPSADDRVVGDDQDRNYRIDPSPEFHRSGRGVEAEGADRAFSGRAADGSFRYDHRIPEGNRKQNVYKQKHSAAVLCRKIRKAPDIAKTDRGAGRGQNEAEFTCKRTAFAVVHLIIPLSYIRSILSKIRTKYKLTKKTKHKKSPPECGDCMC